MTPHYSPQAVILDVDGTLVDSNDAHAQAWQEVLEQEGLRTSYDEIRRLIGMGSDKLIPKLAGVTKESQRGKTYAKRHQELFLSSYLPGLKAFPGTLELLLRLQSEGLRLAIASSADPKALTELLKIVDPQKKLKLTLPEERPDRTKPDPDIIEEVLETLQLGPEDAIMLGDTPYDIEAARRAGMRSVGVRCGGWDDQALSGAMAVYADPADLLRHFESSPFCLHHYDQHDQRAA